MGRASRKKKGTAMGRKKSKEKIPPGNAPKHELRRLKAEAFPHGKKREFKLKNREAIIVAQHVLRRYNSSAKEVYGIDDEEMEEKLDQLMTKLESLLEENKDQSELFFVLMANIMDTTLGKLLEEGEKSGNNEKVFAIFDWTEHS